MSLVGNRQKALSLYKRVLRISQTWVTKSQDEAVTQKERKYIKEEAKTLFRKNKTLTDPTEIANCIKEGEARVEIALHYRIPYPRPVNLPKLAMARRQGKEQGAFQERLKKQVRPIYENK